MLFFQRLERILFGSPFPPTLNTQNPGDTSSSKPEPFKSTADEEAAAKLWRVYVNQAKEYDEGLLKEWKADMETLLIFSALFSAVLTAFIIESYKNLQDSPAQNAVDILSRISQQLNGTTSFTPSPPFKPPVSAVVCNSMWFLSLAFALTCSLFATFVQQWARDFIHKTTQKPSPIRKARVIAFLHFGLQQFGMQTLVDVIPIFLHLSLFLFFGGLVGFLHPVNGLLTFLMAAVLTSILAIYLVLTVLPLLYLNSSYRTPLSGPLWRLGNTFDGLLALRHGLTHPNKTLTEAVLERSVMKSLDREKRDEEAIILTMRALTDDDELLPFIEAIPECIYDFSQNQVRGENIKLFIPILDSADPELNIWSRITHFVSKCGYWTGHFQVRSSQACCRAIWALVQVYTDSSCSRHDHLHLHLQLVRNMPSLFKIVGASSAGSDLCSALATLGVWCIHMSDSVQKKVFEKEDLVLEIFRTISPYTKTMPQVSEASLDMLVRSLNTGWPMQAKDFMKTLFKEIVSERKEDKTWHFIQIFILNSYLRALQTSDKSPLNLEDICDAIYPRLQAPLEVDDDDCGQLSLILRCNDTLLTLKKLIEEMSILDDHTDALMRQHLKLLLSTSKPLCTHDEARQCRQFILCYFSRRYEDHPSNDVWAKFELADLEGIGQCVLEQIEDFPDNAEQLGMSVKVSIILCIFPNWHFRDVGSFFLKLFKTLHACPLDSALKKGDEYPFLKTLLDLVLCIRLVPSHLSQDSLEQIRASLTQDYHPQCHCLDTLNSEACRDTLAIAIITCYMEFYCESKVPSYCGHDLDKYAYLIPYWPDICEEVQVAFTNNVAKLMKTAMSRELDCEFVDRTLADIMAFFKNWTHPFQWITSQKSARVFSDAILQYPEPENIPTSGDVHAWMRGRARRVARLLLKHCQKLLLIEKGKDGINNDSRDSEL